MDENKHKHVFMDDELADNLKREFDRIAEDGWIGDPNGVPAYAYLRVSSRGQAEEGASGLPRQLEHVAEKAAAEGLAIPWEMVYCDDHTGFLFEDRPGLQALMREVTDVPRAHKVVIEYPDRMSRDHAWRYGYIREQFQKAKVEYVYWQGYHSEIERSVMGTLSEQGMRQSLQRMHYGVLKKARSGRVIAKTPAYGYKFVDSQGRDRTDLESKWRRDKHYVLEEEQAKVVRFIYERLAYYGDTLLRLANHLNERGIAPPKRSSRWEQSLLAKMVKNPLYKGEFIAHRWYYKKVYSERSRRMVVRKVSRPRDEWIVVPVPAIVSTQVWAMAQETLKRNRTISTRNTKLSFLLVNLLKCAGCGYAYSTSVQSLKAPDGTKRHYTCYRCVGRNYPMKVVREEVGCTQSQISSRKLDDAVWKVVLGILTEPEVLCKALDDYYSQSDIAKAQEQIAFIDRQLEQRHNEDERLYRAYIKGAFDEDELALRRHEIKQAVEALHEERDTLSAKVMSKEQYALHRAQIAEFAERVRAKLLHMEIPFKTKRRIVRMLVDHIELDVNGGWFKIYGVLKGTFSVDEEDFASIPAGRDSMAILRSPLSRSDSPTTT